MTASLRPMPDFLIIGAQKAGSSALYKFICAHPNVKRALVKEPHFFSLEYFSKNLSWYRAQFPIRSKGTLVGEASPSYCTDPLAPERVKKEIPKTKLIFIVRDPVDRAISNYFHSVKYGWETLNIQDAFNRPLEEFEKTLESMEKSTEYVGSFYNRHAYIHRGFYALQLKRWLMHFPKEQLLVVENNDLLTQPQMVYRQICEFLELEQWQPDSFGKHNVGKTKDVNTELKEHLRKIYREPNQEFFKMIGREYPW